MRGHDERHGRRMAWAVGAVMAMLILAPAAWGQQNQATNGTFDHDVDGWNDRALEFDIAWNGNEGSTLNGGSGPGSMEFAAYVSVVDRVTGDAVYVAGR